MEGKLTYQEKSSELINSVEGWFITSDDGTNHYKVSTMSTEKINSGNYNFKSGDTVSYILKTSCYVSGNEIVHDTVADLMTTPVPTKKVFLIDIDGTVCDDIKNEDSHLYSTANHFPRALEIINKWYDEGHIITFFTARESKDREVTETWLKEKGFKYHGLVMDKPRIKDGQEYVWIDNRKVRAITYLGTWSELKEVDAKIQTFE